MCGRFNIITDPRAWMDALEVVRSSDGPGRFAPRYNIGPSEPPRPAGSRRASPRRITRVPIVYRRGGEFVGEDAVWPLIPVWARGEVPKYSTANARSEEMAGKPAYRNAWKREQRCLIYASGFYEWQARPGPAAGSSSPGTYGFAGRTISHSADYGSPRGRETARRSCPARS